MPITARPLWSHWLETDGLRMFIDLLLPKGATVGEFENVMLNSEVNEVSEVFESQYGFHFLEVTGKRVEDVTDYQIEERAYSFLFSRKYDDELENTLRSMRAEAFVEFKDLD